jgi:type IV pilus assembly protein PilC
MSINLQNYQQSSSPKPTQKASSSSLMDILNRDIQLTSPFGAKQKQHFYSNLDTLLSAGLDIQSALQLIEEGLKKKAVKAVVATLQAQVIEGSALSEALAQTDKFTNYEVNTIRIGEETGQLNMVLKELSDFFEKSMRYRRQLMGALSYPIFVSGFALSVIFFLLRFLVPMFSGIYGRFDKDLPAMTQAIVNASEWLQSYSYLLFLGFLAIIITLYIQRKKIWFRKWSATFLIRLPIFGRIVKGIYLARFCQSMYLLLHSKVPLLRAVELVKGMIAFYPIEVALEKAEQEIVKGSTLSDVLKTFPFFPNQLLALVAVGEEASRLEQMFGKIAEQYNESIDQQTETIGRLIEPILIIGLGVIVGFILIAMYLPLFQMSTTVG